MSLAETTTAVPGTEPSRRGGWWRRLDDALNPIVVKEMRQAARGRFLVGLSLFYLGAQLLALGTFLLSTGLDRIDLVSGGEHGAEAFSLLLGVLLFVLLICLPVYAAVRFAMERTGEGLALLFISTLSPRQLVFGKLSSNLLVGALLLSAGAPYLIFTFFLRGIDLGTMFLSLAGCALGMLFVVTLAVFVAALNVDRLLRWLLYLGGLFFLGWLFLFAVVLLVDSASGGSALNELQGPGGWGFVLMVLTTIGLLFELTVALVSPPAADRARPVRRYLLVTWLISALATGWIGNREPWLLGAWLVAWVWVFAISLLVSVSSRDQPSRRVLAQLPKGRLRRAWSLLLTSGTWPGLRFGVVMLLLTLAAGQGMVIVFEETRLQPVVLAHLGLAAQALAYALLGLEIHRRWLHSRLAPGTTWLVSLVMVAVLSLGPLVLGFFLAPSHFDSAAPEVALFLLFNPVAFSDGILSTAALTVALGWVVLMVAITWRRLRALRQPFQPSEGATA